MIHVLEGGISVAFKNGRQIKASVGDTCLIPKGAVHVDRFGSEGGLRVLAIYFRWRGLNSFLRFVDLLQIPGISRSAGCELSRQFDHFGVGADNGSEFDRHIMCSRLHAIFFTIFSAAVAGSGVSRDYGSRRRGDIVSKAGKFIDRYYADPLSIESIAAPWG